MGRGISGHCGHGQVQLLLVILLQGPLNRMPGQGEGEGWIMALIRSGYHCAEAESCHLRWSIRRVVCVLCPAFQRGFVLELSANIRENVTIT